MQMPRLVQVWASLKAATAALRCWKSHLCLRPSHTRGSVNRSPRICLQPKAILRRGIRGLGLSIEQEQPTPKQRWVRYHAHPC